MRRWLPRGMLDFSLGTPVVSSSDGDAQAGSIYGLVKWSPTHWFGLALRPEVIRRQVYTCPTSTCTVETRSQTQVSLGAEIGWWPGLVAGVSSFVLAGLARADAGQ